MFPWLYEMNGTHFFSSVREKSESLDIDGVAEQLQLIIVTLSNSNVLFSKSKEALVVFSHFLEFDED